MPELFHQINSVKHLKSMKRFVSDMSSFLCRNISSSCGMRDWAQGLTYAAQVPYSWAGSPALGCFVFLIYIWLKHVLSLCFGGWRNGSVVKSTRCSSRKPRFNSQHLRGGSQLSVTPVCSYLTLYWHVQHTHKLTIK